MDNRIHIVLGLCLALITFGCHRATDEAKSKANQQTVLVFAAASTKDALQDIAAAFSKEQKGDIKINADDSSKLAAQITQDVPAQLFLSANEKWAEFVKDKGYAQKTKMLLGNSLVLVVPKGNPAQIIQPGDLIKPAVQRIAVAGPTVPAGIYARQALKKLHLWDALLKSKKIIPGENVRVALTYVERGEAEAGIVYATDALITDNVVNVYTFPSETHDPIRYPLVLLKEGAKSMAARSFFEFLQTAEARDIFTKYGFTLPSGT